MLKLISMAITATALLASPMFASAAEPSDCAKLKERYEQQNPRDGQVDFELVLVESDEVVEGGRELGMCGNGNYKVVVIERDPA